MLAACTAKQWLARNAAGVKYLQSGHATAAKAYTSMVSCLPALEEVDLCLLQPLTPADLGCLLEVLAWCPRLRSLYIFTVNSTDEDVNRLDAEPQDFPAAGCAPAFAKLRSLTKLALSFGFGKADPDTLCKLWLPLRH